MIFVIATCDLEAVAVNIGQEVRYWARLCQATARPPICSADLERIPRPSALALVARFPPMDGAVKKLIDYLPSRSILPAVTLAIHQRHCFIKYTAESDSTDHPTRSSLLRSHP